LALALAVGAIPARADSSFDVSLNTSSLSGTQIIAFSLINGGGGVDNTFTLSDFAFGGGITAGGTIYPVTGGVSGDLSSSITMDDNVTLYGGTALFAEDFNPGTSLSFVLTTTNNAAGATPDAFAMFVCDTSFNCYSGDPSGSGAMLVLNLTGGTLAPGSFLTYDGGSTAPNLPAPEVTNAGATVPEPSSVLFLGLGIGALALCSRMLRGAGRAALPATPA
jgi:hypothetical protein